MQTVGASAVRIDVYDDASLATTVNIAQSLTQNNIKVLPVIVKGLLPTADEIANYNSAFTFASKIVSNLAPYCDTYECGNELSRDPSVFFGAQGDLIVAFNTAGWGPYRGTLHGLTDGVKHTRPDAKTGVDFCICDMNAAQMLWDGTRPNDDPKQSVYPDPNAVPGPQVRWDITMWQWYNIYGDIEDVPNPLDPLHHDDKSRTRMNIIQTANQLFGKPVYLSEAGQNTKYNSDATKTAQDVTNLMQTAIDNRINGMAGFNYYELGLDTEGYGLFDPQRNLTAAGKAYRDFVAAHPF